MIDLFSHHVEVNVKFLTNLMAIVCSEDEKYLRWTLHALRKRGWKFNVFLDFRVFESDNGEVLFSMLIRR